MGSKHGFLWTLELNVGLYKTVGYLDLPNIYRLVEKELVNTEDSIQSCHKQDSRGLYCRCVCPEVAKCSNAALYYNAIKFFRFIWLLWLDERREHGEIVFTSDIDSISCKKWTDQNQSWELLRYSEINVWLKIQRVHTPNRCTYLSVQLYSIWRARNFPLPPRTAPGFTQGPVHLVRGIPWKQRAGAWF